MSVTTIKRTSNNQVPFSVQPAYQDQISTIVDDLTNHETRLDDIEDGSFTIATLNATDITTDSLLVNNTAVVDSLQIMAPTVLKGKTEFLTDDNTGNTITSISVASQAGARTYTIPDAGSDASFVMNGGVEMILGPAGTAALPTYSFEGDPNTGIYNAAADSLGLCTGGTEKWRLAGTDLIPQASNYDIGSSAVPVYRVFAARVLNSGAAFGVAGAGVTALHYGDGKDITTFLTLTNTAVGAVTVANKAIGALIFTFPAGVHVHSVSNFSVGLTNDAGADVSTPVVALGSLIGSGVVAVLHATNALMDDYTSESAVANVNGTAEVVGPVGAVAGLMTGISLNAVAGTKALNFNAAGAWGVAGNILANGTVAIKWTIMS